MKNFNYSLMAAALLAGTVVLSSCSSDELPVGNEVQQLAAEDAMTFNFSAPAMMGDEADTRVFNIGESSIDSRFSTEENVYVYIRRGDVIAFGCTLDTQQGTMQISPLHPDRDGKTCKLVADNLQYYTKDANSGNSPFTPQGGDEVLLYYGLTVDPNNPLGGYYDFKTDGSLADVSKKDYCLAEMVVKSIDNGNMALGQKEDQSKEYFTFRNINSIFRQKFTIKASNGSTISLDDIFEVFVNTPNGKLITYYWVVDEVSPYTWNNLAPGMSSNLPSDGNLYFSTMFNDENKKEDLVFTAYSDGKAYRAVKQAPENGFENNKYYYGDVELTEMEIIKPTITADRYGEIYSPGYIEIPILDEPYDTDNPAKFSIGGISKNVVFTVNDGSIVTLDNLNAELDDLWAVPFISTVYNGNWPSLVLNLKGDNFIKTNSLRDIGVVQGDMDDDAIGIKFDNIKLSCAGSKATLTIYCKQMCAFHSGIKDFYNFYPYDNPGDGMLYPKQGSLNQEDLKGIAMLGYSVERSEIKDSVKYPGYKEFTFTVHYGDTM